MARTKASEMEQDSAEENTPSGKNKKTQQRKRKSLSQTLDMAKKKKMNQEESDSEELSEDSITEGKTQFHKGTTWPLDATLEILVNYEGVKEVRTVKPQFFPLVYHLTRGEPEKIAKAISFVASVDDLLKKRFQKEHKPANDRIVTSVEKLTAANSKSTSPDILKIIPHYGFRDKKGKWLPKKKWKSAEILKNKGKLRKLVTQMPSDRAHMLSVNNLSIVENTRKQRITVLNDAKSAIQSVLSQVSMKRQQYAKLLVWMQTLEMKSHVKPRPSKTSVTTRDKRENKREVSVKKDESKAGLSRHTSASSSNKTLYGIEESAIIEGKRLRSKPDFMPYIPPKPQARKKPAEVNQKIKPENVDSGSTKHCVQQPGTSKTVRQNVVSSNGLRFLFKGQKFSPGSKGLLNRSEDSQSKSESEYSDGESDVSSTANEQTPAGRKRESGSSQPTKNCSKSIVGPNSSKKVSKAKSHKNVSREYLSTSSTDEYSDDEVVINAEDGRTASACSPRVNTPVVVLSKLPSSLPQSNHPPKIIRFAHRKRMEAKNEHNQATSTKGNQHPNLKEGSFNGNVDTSKRKTEEEHDSHKKSLSKKNSDQLVIDVEKFPDNELEDGEIEEESGIMTLQKEGDVEMSDGLDDVIIEDDVEESGEFPPPLVHIENLEGEDSLKTEAEYSRIDDPEVCETGKEITPLRSEKEAKNSSSRSDKSTPNTQPTTAVETLHLLLNQLSALGNSKEENVNFLLSNAKQVLSTAERRLPSSVENHQIPDIKPNVSQMHVTEVTTLNRTCMVSPDSSNQEGNSKSHDQSVEDLVMLNDRVGCDVDIVPSDAVVTVKEEVNTVNRNAGLQNQKEAEAIIIIDDDDDD